MRRNNQQMFNSLFQTSQESGAKKLHRTFLSLSGSFFFVPRAEWHMTLPPRGWCRCCGWGEKIETLSNYSSFLAFHSLTHLFFLTFSIRIRCVCVYQCGEKWKFPSSHFFCLRINRAAFFLSLSYFTLFLLLLLPRKVQSIDWQKKSSFSFSFVLRCWSFSRRSAFLSFFAFDIARSFYTFHRISNFFPSYIYNKMSGRLRDNRNQWKAFYFLKNSY